ncbi:MAG: hypothetical protein LUE96_08495 [Lachnospiraceae bacterium]|nr:hypothetical protein [Lachnospiraceae bacterium]
MNNQIKNGMVRGIVTLSKKITETAVNKSVFIAAYEPDLSDEVKSFCREKKNS